VSDETLTVTRNDEAGRYEIHVGEELGGFTEFRADSQGRLLFPHTELDPAFAGRGLGKVLVGEALKDAAARGETVVPICPFVVKFLSGTTIDGLQVHWREGHAGAAASPSGGGGV
jgi:uncharacterized protein